MGNAPTALAAADFNRDGNPDVVTTNSGTNTVSVLLGTGAGSFGTATSFSTVGTTPIAVAVDDLNRDGIPDLATANSGGSTVSLLLGTGMLLGWVYESAAVESPALSGVVGGAALELPAGAATLPG